MAQGLGYKGVPLGPPARSIAPSAPSRPQVAFCLLFKINTPGSR